MKQLRTQEDDLFIPLYISNLILKEDKCTTDWFHNPTGVSVFYLNRISHNPFLNSEADFWQVSGLCYESDVNYKASLIFENGALYQGDVTHGMLHGNGTIYIPMDHPQESGEESKTQNSMFSEKLQFENESEPSNLSKLDNT